MLRSVDFGESDRILHLLTPRTGRLTVIAKGARRSVKRFPGTLDFFNLLDVQVERRRPTSMPRLELARLHHAFLGIRRETARFALATYLMELLDRLAPEGGPPRDMERIYRFAQGALALLDDATVGAKLRVLLELRALDALGLRPEFGRCVRCGEALGNAAGRVGFHIADGGPVCERCSGGNAALIETHRGTLRALEQSLDFPLERQDRIALGERALGEARTVVTRFLRFHVGIELRSEPFLDATLERELRAARPPAREA